VVVALLAAVLAFYITFGRVENSLKTKLDQSLILTTRAVETEIARFGSLPGIAAQDARILAAVSAPGNPRQINAANDYLARIGALSGASLLFLIASDGTTLAASNHQTAISLVGLNFSFRPYLKAAMTGKNGRHYAIGTTTNEPGYFLSTRVTVGAALVVKVDLRPL
jgi:two-component system C4-dicarboxylate transport sensor histidine kinase DctB